MEHLGLLLRQVSYMKHLGLDISKCIEADL